MGKIYKVVICGMKGVGKTAILEQVIYGKFNEKCVLYQTIEDIHTMHVESDRGQKERLRIYDTGGMDPSLSPMRPSGSQALMAKTCADLARKYGCGIDSYVLVYDTSSAESLDCLITLKREIEKIREKKDTIYVILAHHTKQSSRTNFVPFDSLISKASHWAAKEQLRHFQVNALDRECLYHPFIYIASRITSSSSKSTFPQLSAVRKSIKGDSSH